MSKLSIPSLGEKLLLLSDIIVPINYEYRNHKFIDTIDPKWCESQKIEYKYGASDLTKSVLLPKDTVLTVDRIYIRKGASDFNSVTFTHTKVDQKRTNSPLASGRFWLKLDIVNQLDVQFL